MTKEIEDLLPDLSAWRSKNSSYDDWMATLFQQQVVPDEVAIGSASALAAIRSTQFAALDLIGEAAGTDLLDAEVTLYRR